MNWKTMVILTVAMSVIAVFLIGCSPQVENESREKSPSLDSGEWLRGDVDARFKLVAQHLRGFDMAMVEVGYRYGELYWAARDRNWGYASYQLGKLETAMANGVQRRPKRAASARMLDGAVAQVRAAINATDESRVAAAMETLTATCIACHQAEKVPFIQVAPPDFRLSPVRFAPPQNAGNGGSQ